MVIDQRIDSETVVERASEPLSAPLGDGLVLFSVAQGKYYQFDSVTAAVWAEMTEMTAVKDRCTRLTQRFEVNPQQCEQDVIDLLRELSGRGLIKVHNAAAASQAEA